MCLVSFSLSCSVMLVKLISPALVHRCYKARSCSVWPFKREGAMSFLTCSSDLLHSPTFTNPFPSCTPLLSSPDSLSLYLVSYSGDFLQMSLCRAAISPQLNPPRVSLSLAAVSLCITFSAALRGCGNLLRVSFH